MEVEKESVGGPKGAVAPRKSSGKVVHSRRTGKSRGGPEHMEGERWSNHVTSSFQREAGVGRIWR